MHNPIQYYSDAICDHVHRNPKTVSNCDVQLTIPTKIDLVSFKNKYSEFLIYTNLHSCTIHAFLQLFENSLDRISFWICKTAGNIPTHTPFLQININYLLKLL